VQQHFFIEGRYLGANQRRGVQLDFRSAYGNPLSKLFYCHRCGEVYARCPVEDSGGRTAEWTAVFGVCRKCPSYGDRLAGSIWHFEVEFVAAFNDAVLRWETDRHFEEWEKQNGRS